MFFHALTFAGSQGRCLSTRQIGRVLKHFPTDPASVNAMKQTCDCFSCIVYLILTKFTLKTLLKLYDIITSPQRHSHRQRFR